MGSGAFDAVLDNEMIEPARRAMRQLVTGVNIVGRERSRSLQGSAFAKEHGIIGHVQRTLPASAILARTP